MSFVLVCIYILMLIVRPQDWLLPSVLNPPNLMDYVVVLVIGTMLIDLMRDKLKWPRELPHGWLMLGLFGAALLSDMVMTNLANFINTSFLFGKLTMTFMMVLLVCNTPRRIQIMYYVFIAGSAIISIHCLMQIYLGYGFAGHLPVVMLFQGVDFPRAQYFGIVGDPNDTALLLVSAVPFVFVANFRSKPLRYAFIAIVTTLILWAIYLCQSRGGFLALITMVCVLFSQFLNRRKFIIAMVLGVTLFMTFLPARLATTNVEGQSRVDLWGMSNQIFKQYPLTGIGSKRLTEFLPVNKVPHNTFIHTYTELGVIGYFFWISLSMISVIGCWRIRQLKPDHEDDVMVINQARAMVASLIGFAAAAYFLSRTYFMPLYALLGLAGAIYIQAGMGVSFNLLNKFCLIRRRFAWAFPMVTICSILAIYVSILLINRLR